MKKYILGLLVALFCAFTPQAQASVVVVSQGYNEHNGNFVMEVKATERWCVWRTTDFVHWVKVSPVYQAGRRTFIDKGVGQDLEYAFYVAIPANGKPGNHYGWEQPRNPHSAE